MTPPNALDALPNEDDFKMFCSKTGRHKWNEYANVPIMLEFAKWWLTQHALASEAALERIDKRMEKLFEDACAHQSPNAIHYAGEAMKIVTDERRSSSGQPAPHEHKWRMIYGDPATGKPQIEACDICNQERAVPALAALKAEARLKEERKGFERGLGNVCTAAEIGFPEGVPEGQEGAWIVRRIQAAARREEAQWWADEQIEKDGELSARGAIRLAEIDAAAPPAVTRDKESGDV